MTTTELPRPLEQLSSRDGDRKRSIAKITTAVLRYLTSTFVRDGFDWLLPVAFSRSTDPLWPDPGASIEQRITVQIYDQAVHATLSMIIHKMVACSLAYPKLFLLSPNIRIEKRERAATGIHTYEFTQLDFEVRDASSEEIRTLVERALVGLVRQLRKDRKEDLTALGRSSALRIPDAPFPVRDKGDLVAKYGEAWEPHLTQDITTPTWVTNIPREFYDFEDLDAGRWDNYDLFLPGLGEVLSGARREWTYPKLVQKMQRDGVDPSRYELVLTLARDGRLKPSAGAGIGLERLIAWIVGAKHVAEVQPFPKIPGAVYDL